MADGKWKPRAWPALLAFGLTLAAGQAQSRATVFRLHHFHVRVANPGESMKAATALAGGTRAILQGHGPGVRAGGEYLIFDRASGDATGRRMPARAAFDAARAWIARAGAAVEPGDVERSALARALPAEGIVAVAFAVDDFDAAVATLSGTGVQPDSVGDRTARFRLSDGLIVEVISGADGPDAYWCPMHPDVRSPRASTCPVCGMALVAIPPPAVGEYGLDVTLTPGPDGRGVSSLHLAVTAPASSERVASFATVHERPFHLFVVSRDLEFFAHVHPDLRPDGSLVLDQPLAPGEYMLIADFVPARGAPQTVHRAVVTPGYVGPLFPPLPALLAMPPEQVAGDVRISLRPPVLSAIKRSTLVFDLADAGSGRPVADLEPYLGAAGHLLVVSADLTQAIHAHPEDAGARGPVVAFEPQLPGPGRYKLWVQFQRQGRVLTAPFVIEVR